MVSGMTTYRLYVTLQTRVIMSAVFGTTRMACWWRCLRARSTFNTVERLGHQQVLPAFLTRIGHCDHRVGRSRVGFQLGRSLDQCCGRPNNPSRRSSWRTERRPWRATRYRRVVVHFEHGEQRPCDEN